MTDIRSDAELVTAHLGGDTSALAAIYDRYADALHDTAAAMLSDRHDAEDLTHDVFVVASRRLDQLRDADRLKPWLFAILRHEVYRRTKRRGRERPTDLTVAGAAEMTAPDHPDADGAGVEHEELAAFVRAAAAGLAERDQLLLELSVRHGLSGSDLADAVGVTAQQCHVLVHRMRERVQRSIGALTVARYGRDDCPQLQQLLVRWDGTFDPPTRKRIAGHVDDCEICERTSRRFAVIPLFAAAPAFAAPASLRDRVLASTAAGPSSIDTREIDSYRFDARGGFPSAVGRASRRLLVAAAVVAVLLLTGGTWLALATGDDDAIRTADAAPSPPITTVTTTTTVPTSAAPTSPPSTVAASTVAASTRPAPASTVASSVASTSAAPTSAPAISAPATPPTTPAPPTTTIAPVLPTTTLPSTTVAPTTTLAPTTSTTVPPPAPGRLDLSSGIVDLGASAATAGVRLVNNGGTSLDWAISGDTGPFGLSAVTGTLGPGAATDVVVSIDRSRLLEGDISRGVVVSSSASGGGPLALRASVERDPVVRITSVSGSTVPCTGSDPVVVVVSVTDQSPIQSVTLVWSGPGAPGSSTMRGSGTSWTGQVTPAAVGGVWNWEAVATDARGNTGRVGSTVTVVGC